MNTLSLNLQNLVRKLHTYATRQHIKTALTAYVCKSEIEKKSNTW